MVEHQHGISSFLSFGAKSVQPEILEKLLIGREKVAKTLEKKVKNIAKDGLNHQVIVVGARGTGKTHLLRILYHRAQSYIKNNKIVIAYFAEEEYGIADYLDFMVRILHAFIRWNEEDAEFLNEQLTILQETPSSHQEETVERIIKTYLNERPLLILAENFNDIIETLKNKGQDKLRAWLYRNERTSIIATAQALSDDIGREDRPFYGFFEEIHLQKLTFDESYELLKSLAKIEKREDVLEHLNTKGLAQVKAIDRLVKGNHRLLVTFYEFLKADLLSDLSVTFIKTLNDLKPYYETYIRYLPPQQQKILRFIAMAKIPQLGKEIARQCFIDQKSLSKQLSELTKKKLIEAIVDVTDKRNKLYDIAEPLLRLSIEIGEHKEGVNALFIDFLALYYENEELEAQKIRFSVMLSKCVNDSDLKKYQYEIQARERAIEIKENIINESSNKYEDEFNQKIEKLFKNEKYQKIIELIEQIQPENRINKHWTDLVHAYCCIKNYKKATEVLKSIENQFQQDAYFYDLWALALFELFLKNNDEQILKLSVKKSEFSCNLNPNYDIAFFGWGNSLYHLFKITNNKDILKQSIEKYEKAIKINPKFTEAVINFGASLSEFAIISNDKKILNLSVEIYEKALNIDPKDYVSLYNWSSALANLANMDKKSETFQKAFQKIIKFITVGVHGIHEERIYDRINFLILFILKNSIHATSKQILQIEELIKNDYNLPEELKITYQYLQTYRKVILQGETQALYELPKEQREFFEEEILAKHKEKK